MFLPVQSYLHALSLLVLFVPAPSPRPITVYLGADVSETRSGLTINGVYISSPAQEAGLQPEDEIVTVDRVPVRKIAHLTTFLKKKKPGEGITVVVRRQGMELAVPVKLSVRRPRCYLGAVLVDFQVTEVVPGSPAGKAGLQAEDILVSVDGKKFGTARAMIEEVSTRKSGEVIEVLVRRRNKDVNLQVKLAERPGY